jgi:hypothetical protein
VGKGASHVERFGKRLFNGNVFVPAQGWHLWLKWNAGCPGACKMLENCQAMKQKWRKDFGPKKALFSAAASASVAVIMASQTLTSL